MTGPVLELLTVDGCPGAAAFLPHLQALLREAGIAAPIRVVRVAGDEQARRLRFLGSPTLRVDGRDVDPSAAARRDYGLQCRLYPGPQGLAGSPPDEWVRQALAGS